VVAMPALVIVAVVAVVVEVVAVMVVATTATSNCNLECLPLTKPTTCYNCRISDCCLEFFKVQFLGENA
jgi:hypothetical protein